MADFSHNIGVSVMSNLYEELEHLHLTPCTLRCWRPCVRQT